MFQGFEFVDAHSPKDEPFACADFAEDLASGPPYGLYGVIYTLLGVLRAKAVALNNGLDVLELFYRCAEEPLAIAWHNTMVAHDDTRQNQRSSGVASEWSAAELRA